LYRIARLNSNALRERTEVERRGGAAARRAARRDGARASASSPRAAAGRRRARARARDEPVVVQPVRPEARRLLEVALRDEEDDALRVADALRHLHADGAVHLDLVEPDIVAQRGEPLRGGPDARVVVASELVLAPVVREEGLEDEPHRRHHLGAGAR
jgi:hypothetical protein